MMAFNSSGRHRKRPSRSQQHHKPMNPNRTGNRVSFSKWYNSQCRKNSGLTVRILVSIYLVQAPTDERAAKGLDKKRVLPVDRKSNSARTSSGVIVHGSPLRLATSPAARSSALNSSYSGSIRYG